MGVFDVFKVSRKTFFNPSGWLGWDGLKNINYMLGAILRPLFTKQEPTRQESFEEAMERLGLTEEDLKNTIASYQSYSLLFLLVSIILFTYSFYLLFAHGAIGGFLLGLGVTAVSLIQAYKYDFWVFQMRRRKLGATFVEWRNNILGVKN